MFITLLTQTFQVEAIKRLDKGFYFISSCYDAGYRYHGKYTTNNANSNLFSLCLGVYTHSIAPFQDLYTPSLSISGHYHVEISTSQRLKKKHQYRHIASFERLFYMHTDKLQKKQRTKRKKQEEIYLFGKRQILLFLSFYNLTSGVSVVRLTSVTS